MPSLDTDIVVHKVSLNEESIPMKQKLQRTRSYMVLKVKAKIKRQWDVGFLDVVRYLQWVSNIIVVTKKGKKIRVCVDYTGLNKASSKDDFSLPRIDVLIDKTI
jgi:hypothetical protein